jgi:hypothetical protein
MDIPSQTLEVLVKLAGLGTAGICILGLFVAGYITAKLPDDVSPTKLKAVKMFKNLCITTALICLVAGALTSYFNTKKVEQARNEAENIKGVYMRQINDLSQSRNILEDDVNHLRIIIAAQPSSTLESKATLQRIDQTIKSMDMQVKTEVTEHPVGAYPKKRR